MSRQQRPFFCFVLEMCVWCPQLGSKDFSSQPLRLSLGSKEVCKYVTGLFLRSKLEHLGSSFQGGTFGSQKTSPSQPEGAIPEAGATEHFVLHPAAMGLRLEGSEIIDVFVLLF